MSSTDQIAFEAAMSIRQRFGIGGLTAIHGSLVSIIRSACEEATEPLLATIADARSVIERGVELMTTEQVGKWAGVRSWLEQAPYSESRAASVPRSEPCSIRGESSRICELGTKSCEIKHDENWSREGVNESVANYQVERWQRREKAARDAQLPKKRFIGPY